MEETLHHLGRLKPFKKNVGCLPCINWCRISEPAKQ
jgi:hypothetical protein